MNIADWKSLEDVPKFLLDYLRYSMRYYDWWKARLEQQATDRLELLEDPECDPALVTSLMVGDANGLVALEQMKAEGAFVVTPEGVEYAVDWDKYHSDQRRLLKKQYLSYQKVLQAARNDVERKAVHGVLFAIEMDLAKHGEYDERLSVSERQKRLIDEGAPL